MKPLCAVVVVVLVLPRLGAAQGSSNPATLPSNESDWQPPHVLTAPADALAGAFRALDKLIRGKPAQPTTPAEKGKELPASGLLVFAQSQGENSELGMVTTTDVNVGFRFNPKVVQPTKTNLKQEGWTQLAVDVGIPFYFVRGPYSLVIDKDWRYFTLWGDPYVDVRYTTKHQATSITTMLTATAPIANAGKIYSTGRAGVDWYNHLEKGLSIVSGVTPFLNIGAANQTVSRYLMARPYSLARPYFTLGFIADAEAGASYKLPRGCSIGASYYAYVPGGDQKIYSRLIAPDSPIVGDGNHDRYFTSAYETIGLSKDARDNGFSGWLELGHGKHVSLQVGYVRSVHLAYDALTLKLNIEATPLFRIPKPKE